MEKKAYSVEWLSESSHRNTTYPSVDLLACRSGTSTLQHHKEFSALGIQRPNTTIGNEKENHFDYTSALYQVHRAQAEAQDVIMPRKPLNEVTLCMPSVAPEKHQSLETDSAKNSRPLSEDESSSRPRTKFTKEQLEELEKSFKEHRYIGSKEKKRLSKVLKLSENQIKTWFQNRRMKFKRQSQDARVEAFFSGLCVPYYGYSDLQTPTCPALPGLAMPLAPPPSTHHLTPLSATGMRPADSSSFMQPPNLGSYPYASVLYHPSLKESVGLRYSPY